MIKLFLKKLGKRMSRIPIIGRAIISLWYVYKLPQLVNTFHAQAQNAEDQIQQTLPDHDSDIILKNLYISTPIAIRNLVRDIEKLKTEVNWLKKIHQSNEAER